MYQVESKLRTQKKGKKTDRQVQNNLFGKIDTKGIVKIVSSMMKMSNFLAKKCYYDRLDPRPQRICYSHWANGARNGVISIGQWGVFNHEKGAI